MIPAELAAAVRTLLARPRVLVGLDWIVGGLAFFGLAAVISLGKAGVWSRGTAQPVSAISPALTMVPAAPSTETPPSGPARTTTVWVIGKIRVLAK